MQATPIEARITNAKKKWSSTEKWLILELR